MAKKDKLENGEELDEQQAIAKGGVACPFPWRVHDMLEAVAKEDNEHIVSWRSHGHAFIVHKPKDFVKNIMPRFFRQTKYASFQRQLNLYGFSRFAHGKDKNAYYHDCFVRGKPSLVRGMIRRKIKGTKVRRHICSPDEEPNFYATEPEVVAPEVTTSMRVRSPVTTTPSDKLVPQDSPVSTILSADILPEDLDITQSAFVISSNHSLAGLLDEDLLADDVVMLDEMPTDLFDFLDEGKEWGNGVVCAI